MHSALLRDIWHRMVENYRTDAKWKTKNLIARVLRLTTDRRHKAIAYWCSILSMTFCMSTGKGRSWTKIYELFALSHQISFMIDATRGAEKEAEIPKLQTLIQSSTSTAAGEWYLARL